MPKGKRKTGKQLKREADLLRELAADFDWNAAAERANIPARTLDRMLADQEFLNKGKKIINKAIGEQSGIGEAVKKFHNTQKILLAELGGGNFDVASSALKTHEMEFRMHGLFEKDNKQKGSNVSINISFDKDSVVNVDGEEVKDA